MTKLIGKEIPWEKQKEMLVKAAALKSLVTQPHHSARSTSSLTTFSGYGATCYCLRHIVLLE